MTKYIYGAGGQKSRASRVARWRDMSEHGSDMVQTNPLHMPTHVTGWMPRWWQVRGVFLWALAAALVLLLAACDSPTWRDDRCRSMYALAHTAHDSLYVAVNEPWCRAMLGRDTL